jgi:TonB family protein
MLKLAAFAAALAAGAWAAFAPPRPIQKPEPQFSAEARRVGITRAPVVLAFVVTREGTPRDVRVVQPFGYGLDEEAVRALKAWRFEPATAEGTPVDTEVKTEVWFSSIGRAGPWRLGPMHFTHLEAAKRPVVLSAKLPKLKADHTPAGTMLVLSFEVDEAGRVRNVAAEAPVTPEVQRLATAALMRWQFRPAQRDGKPVPMRGTVSWIRN